MRKFILYIFFFFCSFLLRGQQCFISLGDATGIEMSSSELSQLEAAACALIDSLPAEFRDSFKVFDAGFYIMNKYQQGGFEEVWDRVKSKASLLSQYYLLFGKVSDNTSLYTEIWVEIVLPKDGDLFCIDDISPNLRKNLIKKYEVIANEIYENNGKSPAKYYLAAIGTMRQLGVYIGELKNCCQANRNVNECSACILSNSQFERSVDKIGLLGASVSKVIDNTYSGMGEEEIGYIIESRDLSIDLDATITAFKNQIFSKFPSVIIKTYPFNYQNGCVNFDDIYNNFTSTDADIGLIIGVTGENEKSGHIWWQMISKDDEPITPPTYSESVDSFYYFNEHC